MFLSQVNLAGLEHTDLFVLLEIRSGSLRQELSLPQEEHSGSASINLDGSAK
jgi:hypothetical protein